MTPRAECVLPAAPPAATGVRAPGRRDVERYLRLRAASRRLNHNLLATVPPETMDYVGNAMGILCGRTFFFETESVAAVLADCCFFDRAVGGANLARRYAEEAPPFEGTYEHELLEAMLRARYAVLDVRERVPGVGVNATDLLGGGEVGVLDLDLARRADVEGAVLAARLLPLDGWWMTSAPALEIERGVAFALLRTFARAAPSLAEGPGGGPEDGELVLTIVRACLEGGRTRSRGLEAAFELGRIA